MSVQHARDIVGVSDSTIRHLVRSSELRAAQLRGRGKAWGRLLIHKQSLLDLLEKRAGEKGKINGGNA
jgi:Helix-turn-helix domain